MDVTTASTSAPSNGLVINQDAGGIVSGRVVYADNGEPVWGAAVAVAGTTRGMLTKQDGTFNITRVPVGARELKVRRQLDERGVALSIEVIKANPLVNEPVTVEGGRTTQVNVLYPRQGAAQR